jgi:hypothetical protein
VIIWKSKTKQRREKVKPKQIKQSLEVSIKSQRPCFLWGSPGVGKSDCVRQVADNQKLELIDIRAVLLDPVDLRGIPSINGDNLAHWCIPAFLPRKGKGILFLDELNSAPPLVQAACYQLVLDRKLGEYELPEDWSVIAAGNLESDKAITHRMPSALANRFVHLKFEVDLEDWTEWALQNDIGTEVIAFIRFRPNLLHSFDPSKNEKSFPTPRVWEFVSDLMKSGIPAEIEYDLIAGAVGEGAAAEFVGFLRIYRELPDPDVILMDPDSAHVPDDPATLYAVCGALARRASENNFERVIKYANRLPAEFSVVLMKDAKNYNSEVVNTRAFIEWVSRNKEVLI